VLACLRVHLRQQDVARLHVAVHQATGMRGVQRSGDLGHDGDGALHIEPAGLFQDGAQIRSRHVAHGDEEHPAFFAGLIDRNDVRVVDRSCQMGLTDESVTEPLISR
jgi:hypothetical protein